MDRALENNAFDSYTERVCTSGDAPLQGAGVTWLGGMGGDGVGVGGVTVASGAMYLQQSSMEREGGQQVTNSQETRCQG